MASILRIAAPVAPFRRDAEPWPSALAAAEDAAGRSHAKPAPDSRQRAPADLRPSQPPSSYRPAAPFLAQLIAVEQQVPQMRARKRTDPRAGAAAYAAVVRLVSHRHGEDAAPAAQRAVNA